MVFIGNHTDFISPEIKEQIKTEVTGAINNEIKKREKLDLGVAVLQQHAKKYLKRMSNLELEQYGRRLCLRIEGVPSVEKKTSEDDILGKVKSTISESGCDIPNVIIDRAHRNGKGRYNTWVRAMWTLSRINLAKTL